MAYFSMHAYDADVWIPSFLGLNQASDDGNQDVRYAAEENNLETVNGALQPRAALTVFPEELEAPIETLAWFYRRWYEGEGSKGWMIAASGGKIYYKQVGERTAWSSIELPDGIDAFSSNDWSWVTYEDNTNPDKTIDVVIMSNAKDGMIMIKPPDAPFTWNSVKSHYWSYYYSDDSDDTNDKTWQDMMTEAWSIDPMEIDPLGEEDIAFGTIERSNERIWGGCIPNYPDRLIYSRPYDPADWSQAGSEEQPEDGAGEVLQPTWDGDSFTALKQFGDQLLAFKQRGIWRILGTDPGRYEFKQQYGGGTPFAKTIAVDVERVYFVDENGPQVYDGQSVSPYAREQIRKIWQTVNRDAMDQMCAVLHEHRYYLSFPTGDSTVNNAMLVIDMQTGSILYHDDIYIESLLTTPDGLFATTSKDPLRVLEINYDSWKTKKTDGAATRWVSPWMDFGYKRIQKGGFDLYFSPEAYKEPVKLKLSIQTEKKTKTKEYTVQPLTEAQIAANKEYKYKKLHFGGTGRKFRVILETDKGMAAPWRIVGGLHLVVETDPD